MAILKNKKLWLAVLTAIGAGVVYYTDDPSLGDIIAKLGNLILAAVGL